MTPVGTGILLGVLNVVVIALGLSVSVSVSVHDPRSPIDLGVGLFVFMFGSIPGVIAGALLGFVAGLLARRPRWLRLAVLVVPAVSTVAIVAYPFNLQSYVVVACIPTLVATVLLERGTRYRAPELLPPARVESSSRLAR